MRRGYLGLIVVVLVLLFAFLRQRLVGKNVQYQCGKCGEKFDISPAKAVLAPHAMGNKLVRCPRCGEVSWVTPVPK